MVKKIFIRIGNLIFSAFLFLFFGAVLLLAFTQGGLFLVVSDSMGGAAPKNSVVAVSKRGSYKTGDVISYKYKGKSDFIITHRVVDVRRMGKSVLYYTKGDKNEYLDLVPVSKSEIIGKVVLTLPRAGSIINMISKPLFFAAAFYLPAGFVIGRNLRKLIEPGLESKL